MPSPVKIKSRQSDIAALVRQNKLMESIEAPFRNRLIREKNRYIRKAAQTALRTRSVTDEDYFEHKQQIKGILETYYRRIIRSMSQEIFATTKGADRPIEKKFTFWEALFLDFVGTYAAKKVTRISNTTRSDVQGALRAAIEDPDVVNEAQLTKRILATRGVSAFRASMIARTETHAAAMYASTNSAANIAQETGLVLKKKWIPALDERTRISHANMIDSEAIPMDGFFDVGGERLEYPSDPNGSAGNVINCRCVLVYE